MEPVKKKEIVLEKAALNYKSMDPREKRILNETKTQTYKSMDPIKKKILNETNTQTYKSMDPMKKIIFLDSKTKIYKLTMDLVHDLDAYINKFRYEIKVCPYYICCVCNRLLYKKSKYPVSFTIRAFVALGPNTIHMHPALPAFSLYNW